MTPRRGMVLGVAGFAAAAPLGAAAAAPSPGQPRVAGPAAALRQARALADRQDFAGALRVLEGWLARHGHTAGAPDLALLHQRAGLFAAMAGRPDDSRGHAIKAEHLIAKGAYRDAPPVLRGRLWREVAHLHERLGDPARAAPLLEAAFADLVAAGASAGPAEAAEAAGALGVACTELLRLGDAQAFLSRALELLAASGVTRGPLLVRTWINLANAKVEAYRLEEADQAADAARAAASGDAALLREADYARAQVLLQRPELREAERLLRTLAAAPPGEPVRGHAQMLLASTLFDQGWTPEAAEEAFAALEAYRAALGERHPAYGRVLHLLGTIHVELGYHAAAAAFLAAAAEVQRTAFGGNAPQVHATELERAALEVRVAAADRAARRVSEAQDALDRAAGRAEAALSALRGLAPVHERLVAFANVVLGLVAEIGDATKEERRRPDAAARHYKRAQELIERARGPKSPDLGFSLVRLGRLLTREPRPRESREAREQRFEAAAEALDRAVDLHQGLGGGDTVRLAEALTARAELLKARGDAGAALREARSAYDKLRERVGGPVPAAATGGDEGLRRGARELFAAQARLLLELAPDDPEAAEQAFAASQEALASRAGEALRRAAIRMAAGGGAVADLLRAREEAVERLRRLDAGLPEAVSRQDAAREDAAREVARLRHEREEAVRTLREVEDALLKKDSRTAKLLRQEPTTRAAVSEVLGEDEAVLVVVASDECLILWVVSRAGARHRLLPGPKRLELADAVRRVRAEVSEAQRAYVNRVREMPAFDGSAARELHAALIAPGEETGLVVRGRTRHLLIVSDGALLQLPPHLFIDEEDRWLAERYATTVLPSVSACVEARLASPSQAPAPFLGVGAVLPGLAASQPAWCADRSRRRSLREEIACLGPLPATAEQLPEMAARFGAGAASVLVGVGATKRAVTGGGLHRFRTIAFATHAVMGGELPSLAEPAIVLTPATTDGDPHEGLLTASEIALLSLDADLVVLSACNTAAPGTGPHAEGLSGLARAFLHAGARSLVVSHWPVASGATKELMTAYASFAQAQQGRVRPPEALRRAMLAMTRRSDGAFQNPFLWAPFVVVGG